ncbi:MAG: DUF368 domain-containing protein [Spirochaetia bacterium]|nr:DUF368 domain-containing protein [Spirochaetia bacterium]
MKQYKTTKSKFILAAKGAAMGIADIIPGVSGGTIALISGIYEHLISAIARIDIKHVKNMIQLMIFFYHKEKREKNIENIKSIPWNFFLSLLPGVAVGIIVMAGFIKILLKDYTFETYSFFFGLIFFSLTIPYKKMHHHFKEFIILAIFAVLMYYLTDNISPAESSHSIIYIFFCGSIAICAMILPGISGAYILLVLGEYDYILTALKEMEVFILLPFIAGIIVGIFSFVRIIKYFLSRHHSLTMASLTGIMAGSLNKLWPFEYLSANESFNDNWYIALFYIILGILVLYGLEKISILIQDPEPPVKLKHK